MKKTILLLFIVTVIPILTSCRDNATVFPDMERGFSLEIRADESAEAPDIVLFVERDGDGYKANFTVPEELSNVSVTYGKGTVALISGNVELPLDEKAGKGLCVVFQAVDYISLYGLPGQDEQIEIDGYLIEFEPTPDKETKLFSIKGPGLKRSISLSVPITERNPETCG